MFSLRIISPAQCSQSYNNLAIGYYLEAFSYQVLRLHYGNYSYYSYYYYYQSYSVPGIVLKHSNLAVDNSTGGDQA
jgi:hypothetical protein